MVDAPGQPITLYADPEHEGIRLAVPLILIAGLSLGFLAITTLFNVALAGSRIAEYTTFLSCVGAFPIGLGVAAAAERYLKRVWHSGQTVVIDESGLTLSLRSGASRQIRWSSRFLATRWFFRLKGYIRGGKERRMPAGWLCLAVQFQQEEQRIILFTFMPPQRGEKQLAAAPFHEINPAEVYVRSLKDRIVPPSRPLLPPRIVAGKDGRYWLAERSRWAEGIELAAEDFETLIDTLRARERASDQ
jgi:hypothetical protein